MLDRGRRHYAASTLATLIIAAALLVMQLAPALLRPTEFVQDDSYFYLQIADRIVAGDGSTFHGITPTNGYHPLWMAGVVAADFLAARDRALTLQLVVWIQALLALGTALLFYRLLRRMELDDWLPGLALVLCYLLGTGLYGSEAHLNALLLVAGMLSLWHALASRRWRPWFTTGLLFGFAILARLDNLFVVAALCTAGAFYGDRRVSAIAGRAIAAASGGLLVLAPYLAFNQLEYGHLMPISGAIKSTFPAFDFDPGRLGTMGKLAAPFGLLALVIGLGLDGSPRRRVLWIGLGGGVVMHAFYVAGFTDHYTFWAWYYVAGVLAAGLCAAWLPGWIMARLGPRPIAAFMPATVLVLTLAVLAGAAGRTWLKAFNPLSIGPVVIDIPINEYRWPEEFARWLKANLPPDSRLFVRDWPGATAWHSGLSLLPMDGLVNDFRYNDELLAAGAADYLCAHDVGYFFGLIDEVGENSTVPVMAPLYRRPVGELRLRPEDIVVRVQDVVRRPAQALPVALWRLRCPIKGDATL
jgi:hypothetical protein